MFDKLYGQQTVKSFLADTVSSGRIGHAYAFCGPEGVGRTTFASEFAKTVMCMNREDGETCLCGQCISCRLFENGSNPDLIFVGQDDGKNTIGVETVRSLQESMATAPEYAARKVYIIKNAETMTQQAQNAFLKTVEEPPEYAIIILICSNISLLLETVRSRIIRVDFARNSDDDVRKAMNAVLPEPPSGDEADFICAYADGIIGRAFTFSGQKDASWLRNKVLETMSLLAGRRSDYTLAFTSMMDENKDKKEFVFFVMCSFMRDCVISARLGSGAELQNKSFRDKIIEVASKAGYHGAQKCLDFITKAWTDIGRNVNYRLVSGSLAIELWNGVSEG